MNVTPAVRSTKTNIDSAAKPSTAVSGATIVGTLIGYARVIPRDQKVDHQERTLVAVGVRVEDLYVDRGFRTEQSQLDHAIGALQKRDTLIITTLSRLGRSTPDLLTIAERLRASGAGFRVLDITEPQTKPAPSTRPLSSQS
ncbi:MULTISPECIES: recombinase family protein [unclassified Cryobacterium]|uniref:recombinase family protein n=1 Tax=unclassified Cryobacterium TaxID=2649013 RepID=UPI002AB34BF9|nr:MULTISPECIES: recombinase family protein [unclassified Cryobacterium]MDY7526844.1 recombinase family protein [Cryobacterium sp. 10C2]MDY7557354.1 recombinase family protein [Cryobacterium sp. 10C3]WPX14325.1 recombinase family protein [Cryobacterium sp. 10S3]